MPGAMMSQSSLSAKVVPAMLLSAADREQWEMLFAAAPFRAPFLSPRYTAAIAAARERVFVCVLSEGRRAAGFFPFQFRDGFHKALGVAERAGGDLSDYFGMVCED